MKQSVRIAPPNCMFFLEDKSGGESPEIDDRQTLIWSTNSCVIVGCLPFMDGETEFTASNSEHDLPSGEPAFDGMIETPTRSVEVSTSERQVLLSFEVSRPTTRIRVWINRAREPDRILAILS